LGRSTIDTLLMSSWERLSVRPACRVDVGEMREIAEATYQLYVDRIGREPAPMTADYAQIVESGHAWVAEHGDRIVGLLVLEPAEDHLLLENVAVAPQGAGPGRGRPAAAVGRGAGPGARPARSAAVHQQGNDGEPRLLLRRGYSETHRARQDGFRPIFFTKPLELVTELDLVPVEDRLLGRREARNDRPSARGAGGGAEVREVRREGWSPTQQREGRRWWLDRNSAQDRVARYVQDDAGDPR